ncbi:MAG: ABC transporter substrate-binding protein [Chloroflexota bacterium]
MRRRVLSFIAAFALVLPAAAQPVAAQSSAQELVANVLQGEPDTIDPNRASYGVEFSPIHQAFETLVKLDANLNVIPGAADRWELSPDGRTYTFYLRPDGRWSDGQPVRAQDFEFSYKRILDPNIAAEYASFLVDAGILGADDYNAGKVTDPNTVGIRAIDDLTLQIDLAAPFAPLPGVLTLTSLAPIRQDIVQANPSAWTQDPSTYIGNGPFMLSEWVHQDHMTFVPNPYYHGPGPFLQKLTFLMQTDQTAAYAAYVNGESDIVYVPDPQVAAVYADPTLSQQARQITELTTFWLQFNNAKAPLTNPLVRKAFARAIDRDALIRDIASGVGAPAVSIIPPGMPGYQADLGSDLSFNPQAAHELLGAAGYPDPSAFPNLTFTFATTSGNQRRAEFIQAQLQQNLGVSINLNSMESKAYQAAIKAKSYDMSYSGWGADYPDPQDWFNTLFGCKGGNNKTSYCNPDFDQLVARADTSSDMAQRLNLYGQAQMLLINDAPVAPLHIRGRLYLAKPYVQNFTPTAQDYAYAGDMFYDQIMMGPR